MGLVEADMISAGCVRLSRSTLLTFWGHGDQEAPNDPSLYSTAAQVAWLASRLPTHPVSLLGYSMGGRLALQFATAHPDRVKTLILIGTHPGLITTEERCERSQWDHKQARRLVAMGTRAFMAEWAQLPLIATQKTYMTDDDFSSMQRRRCRGLKTALAASLIGFGSGAMPDCWSRLSHVNAPTLLIAGAEDSRYCATNKRMEHHFPNANIAVIDRSGHAPHLTNPTMTAAVIRDFLVKHCVLE